MRSDIYVRLLSAASICSSTVAVNNTDYWIAVNSTAIFRNLTACAQPCVQFVNTKIFDVGQGTTCISMGCVCSNSTRGPNFVNGDSNVTKCVTEQCGGGQVVDDARQAFADLCLVYTLKSKQPSIEPGQIRRIESEEYTNTTKCAKFVLNGCLNANGTRNEPKCDPMEKPPDWESYRGLFNSLGCDSSECLCLGVNFDAAVGAAQAAGRRYCAFWPSTRGNPCDPADDMMNVLASYCTSFGAPPRNFSYSYSGSKQVNGTNVDTTTGTSKDNKITYGLTGLSILVSLLVAIPSFAAWLKVRKSGTP